VPRYSVPSKDELPAQQERSVLPGGEDYILKVLEIREENKKDYNGNMADVFTIKFGVVSFADGEPLEDTSGIPVTSEPWVWKDVDPTKMGFKMDGTASLGRQFFCAIHGISDLTQRVPDGDTDDLINKTVVATLGVVTGRDGSPRNRIMAFKTPSRRRGAGARGAAQTAPAPATSKPSLDDIDPAFKNALGDLLDGAEVVKDED
jgi:hypothetical protein